VFDKWDSTSPSTVDYAALAKVTKTYEIVPTGKKQSVSTSLTGIPITEFLKSVNVDPATVPFVKIRIGGTNDARIALISLAPGEYDQEQPAMILDKGRIPGAPAPLPTPALVLSQLKPSIAQADIVGFDRKKEQLSFVPAKPGAKIISVRIEKHKIKGGSKAGQYKLTAKILANKPSAALQYHWFAADKDGKLQDVNQTSSYTTDDALSSTTQRSVNVVVTGADGSTGASNVGYTAKKPTNGTKKNPFPPTPSTGSGTGTGTGTGTGVGTGNGSGTGSTISPAPGAAPIPPAATVTPKQQPTQPTTEPTPSTSTSTPAEDTSAITNAAQNVANSGPLTAVSGVLLSAPTVASTGGGAGGAPITQLPAPVATQLNNIFNPVNQPQDVWPYLVTILFALCITGAVREWVNP
jgi:hypothetical protein